MTGKYDNRIRYDGEPNENKCFLHTVLLTESSKSLDLEGRAELIEVIHSFLLQNPYSMDEVVEEVPDLYEKEKYDWSIKPTTNEFSLTDIEIWPISFKKYDEEEKEDFYEEVEYYLDDLPRKIDLDVFYWIQVRIHPDFEDVDIANLQKIIEHYFVKLMSEMFKELEGRETVNLLSQIDIGDHAGDFSMYEDLGPVWDEQYEEMEAMLQMAEQQDLEVQ